MELGCYIRKTIFFILFSYSIQGFTQNSYTPNESLRSQIRKSVWKELKFKTPQKQRFMTGLVFNSNNCFSLYEDAAKKYGWKPYELHTASAFYDIVLNETVSGITFTEKEVREIYEKKKSTYQQRKIDTQLETSQKQEKYDALIINALWVGTVFELSKKKSTEIQNIAASLLKKLETPLLDSVQVADKTSENKTIASVPTGTEPLLKENITAKVDDVILRTVTKYGLDGVYVANDVSILYSNGDIFTNPSKPLNEVDISNSKKENPKKWRTWRKVGGILRVTDSRKGKTYDWKKWFKVRSGNSNLKLSGKFNTLDGFGGATVINASTVVFDKQGRFAWKTIKGGNTDWKPIFTKSASSGTYSIDGYKIILKYNNGVEEAFFFGLYPKDNLHFIIGSSHFVPAKK